MTRASRRVHYTGLVGDRQTWYADPRELWPAEADFNAWLASHIDRLADCLGLGHLEVTGREKVVGYRVFTQISLRRHGWVGGLRVDLLARDEHDRTVLIECQYGPADHTHLGQLLTYACQLRADVAVWVVIGSPVEDFRAGWWGEHFDLLREQAALYGDMRRFYLVEVTAEAATQDGPLHPRMRRIYLCGASDEPGVDPARHGLVCDHDHHPDALPVTEVGVANEFVQSPPPPV